MILDQLSHIGRYRGMHPNLDTAITFLENTDLRSLPLGRTEVDGDQVFALVSKPQLKQHEQWEKHRLYADIQVILAEGEHIAWAFEDDVQGFDAYDPHRGDMQLSQGPHEGLVCPMAADSFAIYFPHDAHRPGLGQGTGWKAVVKVAL